MEGVGVTVFSTPVVRCVRGSGVSHGHLTHVEVNWHGCVSAYCIAAGTPRSIIFTPNLKDGSDQVLLVGIGVAGLPVAPCCAVHTSSQPLSPVND